MGNKCNPKLGQRVRQHLVSLGLETDTPAGSDTTMAYIHMQEGVRGFLNAMNLLPDPSRNDTPERVADMFVNDLCWGLDYNRFPKCTTTPNGRTDYEYMQGDRTIGAYDQMVRVCKIQTISLCEHHFQTIYGWTHIAYIPGSEVLGLSKFARVTEFFARRPQIQERMTEQIFAALCYILKTDDIAVVQDCEHFCMKARGAMQADARTETNKMGGKFMTNPALRAEFLHGIR